MPADPDDLIREREHLAESRRQLHRMRERTASLDASAAADWVSREVLESSIARRMKELADDPAVPMFFGRLDYTHGEHGGESFHVGRRHVTGPDGDALVVDWRAPVSRPFYRASSAEPMGVGRRRRYGFNAGLLTALEDEHLDRGEGTAHSDILESEIERPRVGPMRDIVATIQPEQDDIVRADLASSLCVQGAPGTGKTAVGLHRAAFLLYAHRERLARQGVLVVGPNDSFLRYIADVLPALGEVEATQATITELVTAALPEGRRVRGSDDAAVAVLKGDARMAEVLRRAVWSGVGTPSEALVVPRGSRRWRVPAYEQEEVLAGLRTRGVRYGAAGAMLAQSLAHRVLLRMEAGGESPDDRVQDAVARSAPVKKLVKQLWPAVVPERTLHALLSDAETLAAVSDGVLSAGEQALVLWAQPPRGPGTARWSEADVVLLDELRDLIERTPSVGHLVADEAQDLSPMMLRALARRSSTGSVTVLGDLAQATTPWGARSWHEALTHLGKPDAVVQQLTRGYRVPAQVIEYAARLLPHIAPDLEPPVSVRRSRGELELDRVPDVVAALPAALTRVVAREGSVGVITPDALVTTLDRALTGSEHRLLGGSDDGSARVELVPASLAKGLEFDHVLLVEPAGVVAGEPDLVTGLRRLYVCLTRAVTSLTILHTDDVPAQLGAP
ncbi:HelD family protein [Nocardioides acrostichi]|uniref:AAA family ATPase n=1 Tax=Nocardioides acrostichi TaxID=2784339 RepID=A0A930V0P7_9ACTN|nr:AAA family ATPase [Nocardioides acrostichi]MBF4161580.1 AAA family ATPase [Nocardioides acrostichi]